MKRSRTDLGSKSGRRRTIVGKKSARRRKDSGNKAAQRRTIMSARRRRDSGSKAARRRTIVGKKSARRRRDSGSKAARRRKDSGSKAARRRLRSARADVGCRLPSSVRALLGHHNFASVCDPPGSKSARNGFPVTPARYYAGRGRSRSQRSLAALAATPDRALDATCACYYS